MIHKKPFEFICLLASFLNVAPAAMAEVNKHISQRYTVEKNAMKCAARLAIDALAESGFANDEMTFFATATASSPAHFILRGTIAVANQTRKVSGAVDLNVTAILNADDSPLQDEVGCGIAGSTFAKIQLKDESNSQSLLTNPLFDAAAGEDKCFFVSGIGEDSEGSFENYHRFLSRTELKLGATHCRRVASWKILERRIEAQARLAKKGIAPAIRRILILNGAHGDTGGDILADAGEEDGNLVFALMNQISLHHPTTVIVDSCYSGDLVARKIIFDEQYPHDRSIKNLCLITDATFGNEAVDTSIHDKVIPQQMSDAPENLYSGFDYFKRLDQMALISGSPWEASGVVKKLVATADPDYEYLGHGDYLPRKDRRDACWKILADFRVLFTGHSIDGYSGHVQNQAAAVNLLEYANAHPECEPLPILKLLNAIMAGKTEMAKPQTMEWILESILWTSYDETPFNPIARDWSLQTQNVARNNPLDILRKQACDFR
jgi:hypothetical protein